MLRPDREKKKQSCCRLSSETITEMLSEPTAVEDRMDFFGAPTDALAHLGSPAAAVQRPWSV